MTYDILEKEDFFMTEGIESILNKEFRIKKGNFNESEVQYVIDYILKYVITENKILKDKDTFEFGSWLLQFVSNGDYFEIYELENVLAGKNIYKEGIDIAIEIYRIQSSLVKEGIAPQIPKFSQKIALTEDIYNGSEINGVRYGAPSHMTGWYLTSNSYKGDIKRLIVDYLYFIINNRFDIVKFLALPTGYRFYKDSEEEGFWFDDQIK